ncbi:MAG: alpha/beta hydrolase [Candidatus Saccharimonadales bacterium]
MQIVIQDLLTNYSKQGSGKNILLLHGWGDSSKSYQSIQAALAKSYSVISLDLPGFGATQAPPAVWGFKDYANFIEAFLKKTQTKAIYTVIGHSNGGALAIYGLANGKLNSQKLVLIGAAGIRNTQTKRRLAIKTVAKVGKATTFWLPKSSRQKLQKKLYGVVGSEMLDIPNMQETFKKTVQYDVQADAAKLTLPTLLIYGQNDTATPPVFGEIYADLIKGSDLHVIPDAGHFVHHDQLQATLGLIEEFLK